MKIIFFSRIVAKTSIKKPSVNLSNMSGSSDDEGFMEEKKSRRHSLRDFVYEPVRCGIVFI